MPGLADMRAELRALRKDHVKPVSRMRKGDISSEIERLRGMREETPAIASVPSVPASKSKMKSALETVKDAKMAEFPVKPTTEKSKGKAKAGKAVPEKKKDSKLERMMKLMENMSSDEE
jgi:DNA-nicking Smr family endonuclease